jgi:hypothetical protein
MTIWQENNIQNPIKDRWLELSQGRQKGKAKKRLKDAQLTGIKNITCQHNFPSYSKG